MTAPAVRRADQSAAVRALGAHEVTVGDDIPATPRYDLVIESVGGRAPSAPRSPRWSGAVSA